MCFVSLGICFCCPSLFSAVPHYFVSVPHSLFVVPGPGPGAPVPGSQPPAPGLSLQHPTPWSSALSRRPPAFVLDAVSRCQVRLLAPEPPVPSLQLAATGSRLAVSNSNRSHRYSTECIPKQLLAVEVLAVLVRTWSGIRAHLHPAYHLQFRVQAR